MSGALRRHVRWPAAVGALAAIAVILVVLFVALAGHRTSAAPAASAATQPSVPAASSATGHRQPADSPSSGTGEPASGPASPGASQAAGAAPSGGAVTTRLVGVPASIPMGAAPVEFEGVITNGSTTDYAAVAPVFQIVGGPANHVDATLQRYDTGSGTWQDVAMPEGDGADPLTFAANGTRLAPGQSLVVRYRLSVTGDNAAESTASVLYAVALPGDEQLATTIVRGQITTG